MPGKPSARDLFEALADLVSIDPEEFAAGTTRCHFCLAKARRQHSERCPWLVGAILVRGDADVASRLVGEDEDVFEERLADGEEAPDLETLAAEARAELGDLLAPGASEEALDEPLDAPTAWTPGEET